MGCGASSEKREKYEFLKAMCEDFSQQLFILFRRNKLNLIHGALQPVAKGWLNPDSPCQEETEKQKKRQEAAEAAAKAAKAQEKAWKTQLFFCQKFERQMWLNVSIDIERAVSHPTIFEVSIDDDGPASGFFSV